ncbi:[LSU ribosomal protein L11P]-lysine N-methyltransferase [Desulfacinum hydrothermale DSM 13146]|uniref:Ribosomal protein L11 methyltransferase n=1 Tax=Desulfacinum hydrothermale DSM 13146 TaxID=1121390 RepID=A0A1W1XNS5_9BACT|nr:50S ribosomal protein L11 methyltransferase [Desulfacinum hydrothermale]SMC25171.1 [LSU ribosomal protein L11P]-lysine N-methyltransferase [Desulfacinum hydrothermale DSM 13146]
MEKGWWVVRISADPSWAEELAGALTQRYAMGAEIQEDGILLYVPSEVPDAGWQGDLEGFLSTWAHTLKLPAKPTLTISFCPDQDWNARWKEGFKPLRVGRRFVVAPTWEAYDPEPGDRVLWIDPGRAFGTGHHETTRLCLRWLEDVCPGQDAEESLSLLDVGTGSGILAIAASLLGCTPVVGVDNDPEAIEVARENLQANPEAGSLVFVHGSVDNVEGDFHRVVANIQAEPLLQMAAQLVPKVKKGGRLALSGVLIEHARRVRDAYESLGMRCLNGHQDGQWCLLDFTPEA